MSIVFAAVPCVTEELPPKDWPPGCPPEGGVPPPLPPEGGSGLSLSG
ncbi:MAG: hypothetical protein IJG06_08880 [Clostridia bacterium]|nr:hypothetical protein [Clostridia bacterium]